MFNPERFARLARAHFAEHRRSYLWFLAGVLMLEIIVSIAYAVSPTGFSQFDTSAQTGFYFFGLFVFSSVFAGRYFQSMGQRGSALIALMRPASGFEKWLLAVLVTVVLFPLAYTLLTYVVVIPDAAMAYSQAKHQALVAAADWARHPAGDQPAAFDPKAYALFTPWHGLNDWRGALEIGLWLFFVEGFAMFGSLYFRTVPFIKTILAALVFLLLAALFTSWARGDDDLVMQYWTGSRLLAPWQTWTYGLLWFLVPGMLWVASYRALREREIAA
jgi:hypothetical protein